MTMELGTFFYLRHGQSEANLHGLMCGRNCDSRLTEVGREEARLAARILSRTSVVASICASPQHRAQETAQIVNTAVSVPLVTIDELAEWDVGSWDHRPFITVRDEFLSTVDPPGGETRSEFAIRVKAALCRCAAANQPALIVSHGGVWMSVQQILGLEPNRSENAIPYKMQWQMNQWAIQRLE
jgi:broad specificity phosphatase PhoE